LSAFAIQPEARRVDERQLFGVEHKIVLALLVQLGEAVSR
jgi:hypothetical protein